MSTTRDSITKKNQAVHSTGTTKCAPIYLNLILLNKEELVGNKVTEKAGKGFFGRAAAYAANKMITDEKILSQMADGLIDGVGKAIQDLGISASIEVKFQQGSLVVIRIQIDEIDTLQLILSSKGPEFASNFSTLLTAVHALGMSDTVMSKVDDKIYGSIGEGMATKLTEMIPKKMADKGVIVDCHACSAEEEAEVFFELYNSVNADKA